MISLIIAESALELVPLELTQHPSVRSHAARLKRLPSEILLDNSWHFAAMKGIPNEIKRGRPDIVHLLILAATSIPLYHKDMLKLYVHTINDDIIEFGPNVHIPKSYHRFAGLIEKLYREEEIASNDTLMQLQNKTFSELVHQISPSTVIGFSTKGSAQTYEQVASKIPDNSCIVIGGFQKGHFSDSVTSLIDHLYSIGDESFQGHVVACRILYEYEKTIFM